MPLASQSSLDSWERSPAEGEQMHSAGRKQAARITRLALLSFPEDYSATTKLVDVEEARGIVTAAEAWQQQSRLYRCFQSEVCCLQSKPTSQCVAEEQIFLRMRTISSTLMRCSSPHNGQTRNLSCEDRKSVV